MARTEIIENGIEITYDDNGNLIHAKHPDGFEIWNEYDKNGEIIRRKDSGGYEQRYDRDDNGRIIHYKDSAGSEAWADSNGKIITKEEYEKLYSK